MWSLNLRLFRGQSMGARSVFIDWLSLSQDHPGAGLPVVGDGVSMKVESLNWCEKNHDEMLIAVDPGAKFRFTVPSARREGSHSTAIRLRCDGERVSLSGNPGRYDRADNVFSYDIADTVARASAIVARDGLPAFTPGAWHWDHSITPRDMALGLLKKWDGARFLEMHATQNMSAGSDALAREYIVWAGSQRSARIAKGIYGDESVIFGRLAQKGKAFHKAIVVYRKGAELLAHAKGEQAKKVMRASPVYQYAMDTGLVRVECKWGYQFLRDNGLRYMGEANMGKIISIFDRETGFLFGASPERAVRLVSDMPARLRLPALAWIRGDDIRGLVSRATYFRIVKGLREYGLDVSEPRRDANPGQAERDLQVLLNALPQFDLRVLERPDWYELPALAIAA